MILSLNRIMKLYSNVYDYAIYTQIISCRLILNTFLHTVKHNHCADTLIIIKKNLNFFFNIYKNEWKEYKFW